MGGGQHSEKGGGGWTKQGNWAAGGSVDRNEDDDVKTAKREEAIATILIMTTITMTKVGGGCKGTAHPGMGTTYDIVVIMPNANTRSSSTTTCFSDNKGRARII